MITINKQIEFARKQLKKVSNDTEMLVASGSMTSQQSREQILIAREILRTLKLIKQKMDDIKSEIKPRVAETQGE